MEFIDGWYETPVLVRNRFGLHGRPANAVVDKTHEFESEIRLYDGSDEVDGKSILQIIALCVTKDTELLIRAKGTDARLAVGALKELIEEQLELIDEEEGP